MHLNYDGHLYQQFETAFFTSTFNQNGKSYAVQKKNILCSLKKTNSCNFVLYFIRIIYKFKAFTLNWKIKDFFFTKSVKCSWYPLLWFSNLTCNKTTSRYSHFKLENNTIISNRRFGWDLHCKGIQFYSCDLGFAKGGKTFSASIWINPKGNRSYNTQLCVQRRRK